MHRFLSFFTLLFLAILLVNGCSSSSENFEEPDKSNWTEPEGGGEPELIDEGP